MNTEITEINAPRGRVFYDAECPMCRTGFKWAGPIFARRGYPWLPLQSHGLPARLGLSRAALGREMKLQLADGRVVSGLDTWIVLFRSVGWLWPLALLLSRPRCHALGQACYRWMARNRYCFGAKCAISQPRRPRRNIAFLDLP